MDRAPDQARDFAASNLAETSNDAASTAAYIGFYDYPDQPDPTYDPPHEGPCLVCDEPLSDPVKSVSFTLIDQELPRSYFYRAHRSCYERNPQSADGRAIAMVHGAIHQDFPKK